MWGYKNVDSSSPSALQLMEFTWFLFSRYIQKRNIQRICSEILVSILWAFLFFIFMNLYYFFHFFLSLYFM